MALLLKMLVLWIVDGIDSEVLNSALKPLFALIAEVFWHPPPLHGCLTLVLGLHGGKKEPSCGEQRLAAAEGERCAMRW